MTTLESTQVGQVFLVGAGPGDPELVTVRALRLIRQAEALVYDRLVHPDLVAEAPAEAQRIYVGKAPGRAAATQDEIEDLLIELARSGRRVVRLKGGDPFVFGRGGEEALRLTVAGIPWDSVPAVTSAVGVPAQVSIPVTFRGLAADFAVVTGHRAKGFDAPDWQALARLDTLVILMGVRRLPEITRKLLRHGKAADTPTAIVERGTTEQERVWIGRLDGLASLAREHGVRSPATVIVGEVVDLHERLSSGRTAQFAPSTDLPSPLPTVHPLTLQGAPSDVQ